MGKSELKTKEDLIEYKGDLENEIERLQKIIDASSETTFEIIIEDLKSQMIDNVEKEMWTAVKNCIKEVDAVNGTKNFIEKQSGLLSKKKEELEDIESRIKNYQPSLFETEQNVVEITSFTDQHGMELRTGDIYKSIHPNVTYGYWYYLIKKSSEEEGRYAIVSNFFKGEKLLNCDKPEELEFAGYLGNIHIIDDDQEAALEGLKVIDESKNKDSEKE